jgi:hypothetical protein
MTCLGGHVATSHSSRNPHPQEHLFRTIVELGGGVYRGVQPGDASIGLSPLILFDGPCKSTLALKPQDLSADRVRKEIADKEREFETYADKAVLFVLRSFAARRAA